MGADLFESYVDSLIATMALAAITMAAIIRTGADVPLGKMILTSNNVEVALWLPLVLASLGIIASIVGVLIVTLGKGKNIYGALRNSLYVTAILTAALSGVVTWYLLDDLNPFYAILAGLAAGLIIGFSTEYYTSEKRKPAQSIAESSRTGSATVIIQGLQVGMFSTIVPVIAVAAAMLAAYYFANFYGVAISAVGMLSILGVSLATDCYGPVADNAQGISEMAGMGKEVRENTEQLDAVGNTTAAMGKGFAIGSAAITSLALIFTYAVTAISVFDYPLTLNILDPILGPNIVVGIFIGAMLPFVFVALTMGAVGRAAYQMVEEVRRQFKELGLLKNDKNKPDYK